MFRLAELELGNILRLEELIRIIGARVSGLTPSTTAPTTPQWYIDPSNSSGNASNSNAGVSPGAPLASIAGLQAKFGTWDPILRPDSTAAANLNVTVTFLSGYPSSAAAQADPWLFVPVRSEGCSLLLQGTPTQAFTGSLLSVTAKNQGSGGNALESTFTTTTGAIAQLMLLVNTSRANSCAIVARNLGAGNWELEQPFAPWGGLGHDPTAMAENNAWANGDSIIGLTLPAICAPLLASNGVSAIVSGGGIFSATYVQRLNIGVSASDVTQFGGDAVVMIESVMTSEVVGAPMNVLVCSSVDIASYFPAGNSNINMRGGALRSAYLHDANIGLDTLIEGNTTIHNAGPPTSYSLSAICVPQGSTVLTLSGYNTLNGPLYGAGTLNSKGTVHFGGAAATTLAIATLELDGVATGYSMSTSAGTTTVHGGIALTAANLAAAAGATGFGGTATNLAGASITNGTQP